MIDREEYAVRVMDLPVSVGGFVTESPDGFLNIYINARHTSAKQRRSFHHELTHGDNDDLHSQEPLAVIEARADQKPSPGGEGGRRPGEVPFTLRAIPHLMRARDLLPPPPKPEPPRLTPRQLAVIRRALADLDNFCLRGDYNC